ncbi:transcription elongation factor [Gloeophyllum trabeum ATCC 11539]|uniref:Transcription elongation factor n=1 Tax=Gloeophyllum trabeum (strain ATCC 11539 / FP-39264 / Madison 617) TaxID=670483 RepID=S7PZK3_GLOTA|nr:transcription elongation factor [Gloeophyllum trabeum ATCC 11539]EPQ53091.1 transcription elongation factor [Gloeophyllum trabeum ATCC 11539]
MSGASELKTLVKKLQSASSDEETLGILQTLKKEAVITEALLRESKAGLAVGKLRSHGNKDVSDLAKEVVKKWKQAVEREKLSNGGSAKGAPNGKVPERKASMTPATPITPTAQSPSARKSPLAERTAKSDGIRVEVTGDKTRDKCIEIIYDALAIDSGAPSEQILGRAKGIEAAVIQQFNGANAAYKSKIRSLFVNLKDKHNPGLRESVVSGDLPVAKFATMSSAEMASEERKAADNKIKQENLFNSLGAEEQQAETDAFQCGRCKQRKCRYRQAQTRSADEPMTTFVTCVNCNNRWKFS